ncbi:orexin receptor type 2-like [Ylistrum balloti]|uniref:orexin receptor type 2-like n=1 Tax=Ylistrum balloti TaxID=509963 RepID=UPI002905DEE4|nr:orexin receptor type 2-like [Ylistrum balloti]
MNYTANVTYNLTSSNCSNEMCIPDEDYLNVIETHVFPKPWEWTLVGLYSITFVIGLTGNSLVCFAVWRNKTMRTVTNIFIVNLAVADLTVIIFCLTPTLIVDISETWFLGFIMCKLVLFLNTVSISVSVLTLSAISVERWYAICYPLVFKSTKKRAKLIISAIWLFSVAVAVPDLVVAKLHPYFSPEFTILLTSCKPGWSNRNQTIYQLVLLIVLYVVPMVLMGFTYSHIAVVLWKGNIPGAVETARKPMMNSKMNKADEQLESRKKAAKMLITIVIIFAVSYFPVHLLNIFRYTGVLLKLPTNFVLVMALISHWLPYFNSSINPVIYNFMSAKFRKEFRMAISCGMLQQKRRIRGRGQPTMSIYSNSTTTQHFVGRNYSQTEQITLSNFHDKSETDAW